MLSMASNTKGIDIEPTDAQRPSVAVAPQKLRPAPHGRLRSRDSRHLQCCLSFLVPSRHTRRSVPLPGYWGGELVALPAPRAKEVARNST